jgi:hypothetical protein
LRRCTRRYSSQRDEFRHDKKIRLQAVRRTNFPHD